jgi:hypothetical protein
MSLKCCEEFGVKNCVIFLFHVSLLFANDVYSDILSVG